jgi:hypothetical protein
MNKLLIAGGVLSVMMGAAFAQTSAPPPPSAPPPGGSRSLPPFIPSPSKGAHFRLQDGDAAVDVKCAEDEPMKLCADITLQILEKLVSLPERSLGEPGNRQR